MRSKQYIKDAILLDEKTNNIKLAKAFQDISSIRDQLSQVNKWQDGKEISSQELVASLSDELNLLKSDYGKAKDDCKEKM